MTYEVYKVIHLLGIMLLFSSLGGSAVLAVRGGDDEQVRSVRKLLMAVHGVAMLVVLVAGFGLLARIGKASPATWLSWVYVKIGLWLVLGGAVVLIRRMPDLGKVWLWVLPLVGTAAAYVAVNHPPG